MRFSEKSSRFPLMLQIMKQEPPGRPDSATQASAPAKPETSPRTADTPSPCCGNCPDCPCSQTQNPT